jgi:hypothetical protein
MVQIDVPAAFAVGSFFADAARRQIQRGDRGALHSAWVQQNIFQAFFFVWIPVYFIANYFGWETTHMWWDADSVAAYPFFLPLFLLIFFAAANAGFLLGVKLVRAGRVKLNRASYLGILAASAAWILGQTNSTFKLGSYAAWKAGEAPWFYQDATFLVMLIFVMIVWMSGLVYFYRRLSRAGAQAA